MKIHPQTRRHLTTMAKVLGIISLIGFTIWLLPPTLRAIAWVNGPKPPPPLVVSGEQPTVGDTQPQLTGYYLELPEGAEDWTVTYDSYLVEQSGVPETRYSMIRATWWYLEDGVWKTFNPVIRPLEYADR